MFVRAADANWRVDNAELIFDKAALTAPTNNIIIFTHAGREFNDYTILHTTTKHPLGL